MSHGHLRNLLRYPSCNQSSAAMLHCHNYLRTLTTPWYEALRIAYIPFHKHSWRLDHPLPACSIAWHTIYPYKSWTRTHHLSCRYHHATFTPERDIATSSTQPTLQICNNQCHPQSYPHHQIKSGHKPSQPGLLLWIHILLSRLPFWKFRHFWRGSFECNGFIRMQQTKIPFCGLRHFRVVKVTWIWLANLEVFKKLLKKKLDVR